jgi:FtsH-binding integral membrane protein
MIMLSYLLIHVLSLIGWLPPGFLPYNEIVFSILGCTLFTLFLAYDTRLIVSGKHTKYQLNQKDYVFGAALLYHDIVAIFLYLLKLLDNDDRGS